jgi:hypothetical protein
MTKTTKTTKTTTTDDFDSPWKGIIERYFPDLINFFFPNLYTIIDWTHAPVFLDKELQKLQRQAQEGKRLADKLVKVRLRNGESAILYIHLEIQGQYDKNFPKRMFIYYYRFFDHYGHVISLAILTDDDASWRPQQYQRDFAGCNLTFQFPTIKLLDYWGKWKELEASTNPFAMVVMAHLRALETQRNPARRLHWKVELYKLLHRAHYTSQQILDLFWFMDWVLTLPERFEQQFEAVYQQYEEANNMEYVTSVERRGIQKGLQQGILQNLRENVLQILQVRFKQVPKPLIKTLQSIEDTSLLSKFHEQAVVVNSLEEFKRLVSQTT